MEQISCIYIITNTLNDIYIGQTINFRRRYNSYKNFITMTGQSRLKKSFTLYGFESHSINILLECKNEELNFWEEFYVKLFDSFKGDNGLNSTSGGKSHKRMRGTVKSKEWRENISKAHIGKKREPFSLEWRENISKAHKGIVKNEIWLSNLKKSASLRKENGGYVISEEQKEKFRKSYSIFLNSDKGIEQRKKSSLLTKNRFSKPVIQYSLDMEYIKTWVSAREAANGLGICHPNLINCTNNKAKTAGGFIWRKQIQIQD